MRIPRRIYIRRNYLFPGVGAGLEAGATGIGTNGGPPPPDILSILSALITVFQLPPRKDNGTLPVPASSASSPTVGTINTTVLCSQHDFIVACSCLLCCICENLPRLSEDDAMHSSLSGAGASDAALVLALSRSLLHLSYTCLVLLWNDQALELMNSLCLQVHWLLLFYDSALRRRLATQQACDLGQYLSQARHQWCTLLEPLQFVQHPGLALVSTQLFEMFSSLNSEDD